MTRLAAPTHSRFQKRPRALQDASAIAPMLATLTAALPPDLVDWVSEYKWDGVRGLFIWDSKRIRLLSRNNIDMAVRYPELSDLGRFLGKKSAVLDGEIVALESGTARPSFPLLQHRMHVDHPDAGLQKRIPIFYIIFDLLKLGSKSLVDESYSRRRTMLETLGLSGPAWQLSPNFPGATAPAMLDTARKTGLEGIVLKRATSVYEAGRRSRDWLKLKVVHGQELVIGGWVPEAGDASGRRVGALLMGYYNPADPQPRALHYAGSVGSGFTGATHLALGEKLRQLKIDKSPFAEKLPRRDGIYVKPQLVADIEFRRWPRDGYLQQAAFKGLRVDKKASEVVKEDLVFEKSE